MTPVLATTTLTNTQAILLLCLVVAGMLAAGLVVILARTKVPAGADEQAVSVLRSWIAISLVFGLLVFCAAAFLIDAPALRSTLFGGLIASVGAAVAFYFSSKTADQARSDILQAAVTIAQGPSKPTLFTADSPPNGKEGAKYQPYRFAADGQPRPTYKPGTGALPKGMKIAPNGTLAGTPTEHGEFTFSVVATNASGSLDSGDIKLTIDPK
jgi:hypothetical protein